MLMCHWHQWRLGRASRPCRSLLLVCHIHAASLNRTLPGLIRLNQTESDCARMPTTVMPGQATACRYVRNRPTHTKPTTAPEGSHRPYSCAASTSPHTCACACTRQRSKTPNCCETPACGMRAKGRGRGAPQPLHAHLRCEPGFRPSPPTTENEPLTTQA